MDIHGVAPLLQVFDMPTSLRFYRDVLGFTVWGSSQPGDNCNWCGLRLYGAELMLNTAYEAEHRPAAPDPARIAAHGAGHHDDSIKPLGGTSLDEQRGFDNGDPIGILQADPVHPLFLPANDGWVHDPVQFRYSRS